MLVLDFTSIFLQVNIERVKSIKRNLLKVSSMLTQSECVAPEVYCIVVIYVSVLMTTVVKYSMYGPELPVLPISRQVTNRRALRCVCGSSTHGVRSNELLLSVRYRDAGYKVMAAG